jgi:hypothetical protein
MERKGRDFHERDPHFDGRLEGTIQDSGVVGGDAMGIRSDINLENFEEVRNPFHIHPKRDENMKKFSDFFDEKKKEK